MSKLVIRLRMKERIEEKLDTVNVGVILAQLVGRLDNYMLDQKTGIILGTIFGTSVSLEARSIAPNEWRVFLTAGFQNKKLFTVNQNLISYIESINDYRGPGHYLGQLGILADEAGQMAELTSTQYFDALEAGSIFVEFNNTMYSAMKDNQAYLAYIMENNFDL